MTPEQEKEWQRNERHTDIEMFMILCVLMATGVMIGINGCRWNKALKDGTYHRKAQMTNSATKTP